ncbi:MAG: T9SS type A sorting domain-containing protein [Candidatus Krumholzibacteriota bacterium]|nr:T9SS type A sorting domain-containing protein [Candidatus Krumholzibacteriota bacterium]
MRIPTLATGILLLLLLGSSALGQSYEMTIHLGSGETVVVPLDDIRRIEFANILTGVQDPADPGQAPPGFQVLQNYPNPFNPSTAIEYLIPDVADVTVRVFDLKGALVRELLRETQAAGRHRVTWDGTNGDRERVPSGVYFCAVACGEATLCRQLILVK